MSKRIILIVSNMGNDCGKQPESAEESWYWKRNERDIAECGFWLDIQRHDGNRGLQLMDFFIPRELTELINSDHWTGKSLRFSKDFKNYKRIKSIDVSTFIDRWPRNRNEIVSMFDNKITLPEIECHQTTLLHGWLKLISVWFCNSVPDIAYEMDWWEVYLTEEMMDFVSLYLQAKQDGIKTTIQNPRDHRNHKVWLKIASCCLELLTDVCPTVEAILKFDRGRSYPALWAGLLWMKRHKV